MVSELIPSPFHEENWHIIVPLMFFEGLQKVFRQNTDDEATAFTAFTSAKTIKKLSIPEEEVEDRNMPVTTAKPATAPTKAAPKEEGMDVAENVYAKAKDVWAWGKGVPLVGIGLGITEAVAGKVASVAGTDLSKIDEQIKPQLATLDSSVINPAIVAVVGAVMGAAGKTGDFVHPILVKVLSPFGLLKNEPENPELTE